MSGKERGMLWLLAAINFTHILDFMIMMPLGNYLMPYFHISAQQFSFIVASYTISAGISGFTAAFFVDNYDRKKVLLFAYIGFVIGTLLCGLAPTYHMLLGARILAGIFGGLIGAQVLSIVADSFSYERRGKAMGTLMSAFSLASVIGVPLGLFLATRISWHAPFLLVGGMGLIIIPLVIKYLPSVSGHLVNKGSRVKPLEVLSNIFRNPPQVLALSFSALMMMGHFVIIPFLNPYMEFNVGFTKDQTMLIYTVGGLSTFFTAPYIGKLADKYGKRRIFTIFVIASLVPIFLITNMPAIPFYYVLVVTGIWFILSLGRNIPAQAMISNVVEPVQRGSFMSFNSSVQQMFTGIASLIAGVIVIKQPSGAIEHYPWVGYLSMALVCCSIFIARRIE
ncbi:MAG TPA: MFS transporter [Parasegetibacter sp.]